MTPCRGGSARRSENVANCYSDTSGRERGMLIVYNAVDTVLTVVAIAAYGNGETYALSVSARSTLSELPLPPFKRVLLHQA